MLTCSTFDDLTGARLFFKCENLQKVGAFKYRGATNAVRSLPAEALERGVVTHSSGNHAQALACAAAACGTRAVIVMPSNAPRVKLDAVRGYGAEVRLCEPTQQAREAAAAAAVEETGGTLVHPFDDPRIIAGQSTAVQELLDEVDDLDMVLAPVGGGGLLSGTALGCYYLSPRTEVWGTEPKGADDAYRSWQLGRRVGNEQVDTICDGLRTSMSELTFSIAQRHVSGIVTIDDTAVVDAMKLFWERMKLVIESSAAVPVAALFAGKLDVRGKRVGIILSGGNIDLDQLPWLH